jgi:II/X family phage/plasmid replication protein
MIDWSLVAFPLVHDPIYAGEVISVNPDGTEDWRSPRRTQATGSFEKTIGIKSIGGNGRGQATDLWMNGNPAKFLQGHNVFGSDDLVSLLFDVFCKLIEQFDLKPSEEEIERIRTGDYPIGMVDINYSFLLPSRADVLAFIRALEFKAKTRHGKPSTKGGTLYFGKTSEYWAIKFYCKAEEIQTTRGKLPLEIQNKGIEEWVDNILRIELRLLSKQLKRLNINKVKDLNPTIVKQLFNEYLRKIDMTEQIKLTDEIMINMPNKLRSTYTLWSEGHDLRGLISRPTYYRHRKDLKAFGINIDLRPESIKKSNVVPLVRILEAQPIDVPAWAFEQNLVHLSALTHS